MSLKELLTLIVKELVDTPDSVEIKEVPAEVTVVLEVKVAKSDLGKVIGKKGRNAQALRTIVTAIAAKRRKMAVLEILEL